MTLFRSFAVCLLAVAAAPALALAQPAPGDPPEPADRDGTGPLPPGAERGLTPEEVNALARQAVRDAFDAERAKEAEAAGAEQAKAADEAKAHDGDYLSGSSGNTDVRLAFWPEAYYILVSLQDASNPVVRAFRIIDEAVTEEDLRGV